MKYLLPAFAILALAVCAGVRLRGSETVHRSSMPLKDAFAGTDSEVRPPAREAAGPSTEEHRPVMESKRLEVSNGSLAQATAASAAPEAPSTVQGLLKLMEPMDLTEEQASRAQAILMVREEELRTWHESIRRSRIFNPEEYGRSLQQRREAWYRSLDALLDSEQHVCFQGMMARNFLGQGTEFSVNHEEMTVVR